MSKKLKKNKNNKEDINNLEEPLQDIELKVVNGKSETISDDNNSEKLLTYQKKRRKNIILLQIIFSLDSNNNEIVQQE